MDAFGKGNYVIVDKQNIIARFGNKTHVIKFIREGDSQVVNGKNDLIIFELLARNKLR